MFDLRPWIPLALLACANGPVLTDPGNSGADDAQQETRRLWIPLETELSPGLTIRPTATQRWAPDEALVSHSGEHLLFYLDGQVCRTVTATSEMDIDEPTGGYEGDVIDTVGEHALVRTRTRVFRTQPGDDPFETLIADAVITAEAVGDDLAHVDRSCMLHWNGVPATQLGPDCGFYSGLLVEAGEGVLVTTDHISYSTPAGTTLWDELPADVLAYEPSTGMVGTIREQLLAVRPLTSPDAGWSLDLGDVTPLALHGHGATQIFAVELIRDQNYVVEMYDAATGEALGTLDPADRTYRLAFAADAATFVSTTQNNLRLWHIQRDVPHTVAPQ